MPKKYSYDPECGKLAEYFLVAEGRNDVAARNDMAQFIQDAVELFFFSEKQDATSGAVSAPDRTAGAKCCECGADVSVKSDACKYPGNHSRPLGVDTCDHM